MTVLRIKNMVCDRCLQTVERIFKSNDLNVNLVELGSVHIAEGIHEIDTNRIGWQLREAGFDLLVDKNEQLTAKIKVELLKLLEKIEEGHHNYKLSVYLSELLAVSYQQISRTFSEQAGETVERYFMKLKIERVKELLSYGELTLSEIAWRLGYSSVQHLSTQFKTITGMTVSEFKKGDQNDRVPLDTI